jgi:hypothetical protein
MKKAPISHHHNDGLLYKNCRNKGLKRTQTKGKLLFTEKE